MNKESHNEEISRDEEGEELQRYKEHSPLRVESDPEKLGAIKEDYAKFIDVRKRGPGETTQVVFERLEKELGLEDATMGELVRVADWVIDASERAIIVKEKGFKISMRASTEGFRGTIEKIKDNQKIVLRLDADGASVFGEPTLEAEPKFVEIVEEK